MASLIECPTEDPAATLTKLIPVTSIVLVALGSLMNIGKLQAHGLSKAMAT